MRGSSRGARLRVELSSLCAVLAFACDGAPTSPYEAGDDPAPPPAGEVFAPPPATDLPACELRVSEVAMYQAVKVPLLQQGPDAELARAPRTVDIVAGRPALVRVFVNPGASMVDRPITMELRLRGPGPVVTLGDTRTLSGPSDDGVLDSTFNFRFPVGLLPERGRLEVTLGEAGCDGKAIAVNVDFVARRTGALKVRLVPIQYDADASGRLPDLSPAQVDRYRDLMAAMYPVTAVEVDVRAPVRTSARLTGSQGWGELLDGLRDVRARDGAPADVHYYGLVNPAPNFRTYCGRACTAGIAYVTDQSLPAFRVGLGIGFAGEMAAQTLAHELGHQHGRLHAPCNVSGDKNYPHQGGRIGTWGFDIRNEALYSPAVFTDVMGYCDRVWVSDYSYQGFVEHLAALNAGSSRLALTLAQPWRVLLVDEAGANLRWGHPIRTAIAPEGVPERARVLDENGALVEEVLVYRVPLADASEASFLVPEPANERWHSLAIQGLPAQPFAAPVATPVLL